jgi:hypothetical protein
MTAIAGTSLFYSASKTLQQNTPISYYQFKAIEAFLEVLVLHNELHLFVGEENDKNYLQTFEWLIREIHEHTDFKITLITSKNYIESTMIQKFETICQEIYQTPLGITSTQLFTKKAKNNRVEDDLSEIVTNVFAKEFDSKKFSQKIYETFSKNSTTATFQYLFRGHFFQAVSEILNITPVFVNHRLIANILHKSSRQNNRVGTLAFSIYKMVNNLFLEFCRNLGWNNQSYPFTSILMMDLICHSDERQDFLKTIYSMRNDYKAFRDEYKEIERILDNQDESLQQKAAAKSKFERYIQEVWLPIMSSLNQSQSIVKRQLKKSLGKFNIGDSKLETTAKYNNETGVSSESEGKSSINLTGLGVEVVSLFARIGKDTYLMKPNRPLLNSIKGVIENIEIKKKFLAILPVKDFANTKFQEIDKILLQIEKEN